MGFLGTIGGIFVVNLQGTHKVRSHLAGIWQ